MPRKSPFTLRLTAEQRRELERRARAYTLPLPSGPAAPRRALQCRQFRRAGAEVAVAAAGLSQRVAGPDSSVSFSALMSRVAGLSGR
jgi:hypothetical protein